MNVAIRNNINILGRGERTMLMAHGFGCDQSMFRFLADAFQDEYRLVLFDYTGSGRSDIRAYDERRYSSLDGYKRDVLDIVEQLDLHDVIVVAHSVSSMIGAMAAVEQPERFSDLIMIAPSPRYLNDPPQYHGGFDADDVRSLLNMMEHNYSGWAHYMAPVSMKNQDQPHLTKELASTFCAMDPYIARRFAEVTFNSDSRDLLPRIKTPTLILQCTDDTIAAIDIGNYLAANIPDSVLRIMNATGHCPHLSQPGETIDLIRDYLARQTA